MFRLCYYFDITFLGEKKRIIRPGKFLLPAIASFSLLSSLFIPSLASAYSGYGFGTQSNPYLISSCQQLQDINQNLAGYYVLVSNVDCSGFNFSSVGNLAAKFSGQLDGGSHTILNLVPADGSFAIGLFGATNGAVIKNLKLDGGTLSISPLNVYVGGVVGFAQNTTLMNVHSNQTINSNSYGYLGGLVGILYSNDTITESSFSGNLSGTNTNSYTGGIAGLIFDSATSINNSYTTGTISPPTGGYSIGGIVGSNFVGGTIANVYSTVTFSADGISGAGGLIGLDDANGGRLENSFAAATITGTGTGVGALIGQRYNSTPLVNDYFDQSKGPVNCVGSDFSIITPECSQENEGNLYPNYFKNNTSNGPFSHWDFTNIWQQNESYPVLKNEAAFVDPAAPNNGDANNDGIPDSYQANVANVQASDGTWSTMVVPADSGCVIRVLASIDRSTLPIDTGFTPLTQLDAFTLSCISTGDTFPVTMIFDKVYTNPIMRLYDGTLNAYHSFSSGSQPVFSTVTIGGIAKTKITYNINEGASIGSIGSQENWSGQPRGLSTQVIAPNTGFGVLKNNSAETIAEYVAAAFALLVVAEVIRRYTR